MEASNEMTRLPPLDENGLLFYPDDWNESVAEELARLVGIKKLSEDHWLVIYALRDYYAKFGVAPSMHNVCHSNDKNELWVHNLFATCLNAWCVSGLPNPGEEAKSYLSGM